MVSNKYRILTALEHFQLAILMLPSPFSAESISIGCKHSVCLQLCDFVVVRGGGVIHRCPAPFLLHHHHSHLEKQLLTGTYSFGYKPNR